MFFTTSMHERGSPETTQFNKDYSGGGVYAEISPGDGQTWTLQSLSIIINTVDKQSPEDFGNISGGLLAGIQLQIADDSGPYTLLTPTPIKQNKEFFYQASTIELTSEVFGVDGTPGEVVDPTDYEILFITATDETIGTDGFNIFFSSSGGDTGVDEYSYKSIFNLDKSSEPIVLDGSLGHRLEVFLEDDFSGLESFCVFATGIQLLSEPRAFAMLNNEYIMPLMGHGH